MQLSLIDRLPTPWKWVGKLGSLSGDSTAALPVCRFRRVFTAPVGKEEGIMQWWSPHRSRPWVPVA
eukprot:6491338-Amphidinium_carterae.1